MKRFKNNSKIQDPNLYFRVDHLTDDLKGRTVRGGAATMVAQVGKFALQTASTVVVARLLSPEDYGLLGMVTILTGFANLFSDLGLSAAIIQKADINHKQVSTLFWINLLVGFSISLITAILAPVVANFYNEPRLVWITIALSFNFVLGSLAIQHTALLQRQMRFVVLGQLQIVSMLVSIVTAIAFAYYGFQYWALVFMQWANLATNAMGVWLVCGWRPGLPARSSGIRSMLAFGGNLTGFRVVNYLTRNLDNLLLGRYWGAQSLGLYAKAYQLLLLPVQQLNRPMTSVAIPALSSLQSNPERYKVFYFKAILAITTLSMPIMAFMFASADKLILVMLGEEWSGAILLFRLLMPAAFVGTFYVATTWVYQSLGRTQRQFRIGLINSTITSVLFLISLRWGAVGMATAFGISQPILYIPALIYCYNGTHLRLADLVNTLYRPVIASIGAASILILLQQTLIANLGLILIIGLVTDCFIYVLLYFGIWMILPNGSRTLLEIFTTVKSLKK